MRELELRWSNEDGLMLYPPALRLGDVERELHRRIDPLPRSNSQSNWSIVELTITNTSLVAILEEIHNGRSNEVRVLAIWRHH
jgi:hypothetical protein